MRDYADACFRYFRFTEMFMSDGRSIRIAPDKIPEIDFVLETVPREPAYIDDITAVSYTHLTLPTKLEV